LSYGLVGPLKVERQLINDVHCKHLATRIAKKFHVTRCGLFKGTRDEAFAMACLDRDQHVVQKILEHRGDALKRAGMEFRALFADGDIRWLPYSTDINSTVAFEDYMNRLPELVSICETMQFYWLRCCRLPWQGIFPGATLLRFYLLCRDLGRP